MGLCLYFYHFKVVYVVVHDLKEMFHTILTVLFKMDAMKLKRRASHELGQSKQE